MDLENLTHADGADNTAGIGSTIIALKLSDIETLPEPQVDDSSSSSGTLAQLVTVSANIVMKQGKVGKSIYCTLETGGLDCVLQGNLDGKSFKNSVKIQHPGSSPQLLGFMQYVKNGDVILLVEENDGQVRMLGHRSFPAKLESGSANTGSKTTDDKAAVMTFYSVRKGPAPVFTGKVQINIPGGSGAVDANSNSLQDIYFMEGS